jgi:hypothetical protein
MPPSELDSRFSQSHIYTGTGISIGTSISTARGNYILLGSC